MRRSEASPERRVSRLDIPCGLALFLVLVLAAGCSRTVIEVNGQKVSKKIFEQEFRERQLLHEGKHIPVSDELLKQSTIAAIINRAIILQEAKKEGITLTKEEFKDSWEKFKRRFVSDEEFQGYLKKRNMSEGDLKKRMDQIWVSEKLYQKMYQGIAVSDGEVKRYYLDLNWKEVGPVMMRAGMIKTSSRDLAENILAEIKESAFDRVLWDLLSNKRKGVSAWEPRWIDPESFDQDIVKEMKTIITARYNGPVRIKNAWYIIKIYAREAKAPGFERVKEDLRKQLHEKRAKEAFEKLLQDRIVASEIKIYHNRL